MKTQEVSPVSGLSEILSIPLPPLKVRRFVLASGVPDSHAILQHLDYFKQVYLRHGVVRLATVKVLDGLDNNDVDGQIERIFEFVKEHMIYVRDPIASEYVISPVRHLRSIAQYGTTRGDCDDHALLLNSMLGSIGIKTKFVGVKLKSNRFNHVISSVLTKSNGWVDLDPCAKSVPQRNYQDRLVI